MPDNASVSTAARRRPGGAEALEFPQHSAPHTPPCLPVFPRIDAWPLQRGPWTPQEARMIKKPRSGQQQQAHRGLLEGSRNVTSPVSDHNGHLSSLLLGSSPEAELTLRKGRIPYGGGCWGPEEAGPRKAGCRLREQGKGQDPDHLPETLTGWPH